MDTKEQHGSLMNEKMTHKKNSPLKNSAMPNGCANEGRVCSLRCLVTTLTIGQV